MTTRASYFVSPLAALVAFVASMAVLLLAYGVVPAQAAGSCSTTAGTTTCTFGPTGSEDTFTVPDWVSSVHVEATGAPGAGGFHFGAVSPAGRGATVRGDLTVTPGDTLYVNVGDAPTTDTGTCITDVACIGGFNGGGSSAYGGGGGGASDVRTVSSDQSGSLDSRLIVAGGSGEVWRCFDTSEPRPGGGGGDASSDGGDGTPCGSFAGGTGGEAGGQGAGGVGGSPDGGNGSLGLGGNGGISGSANGGGGGGGGALNYDSAAKDYVPAGGGGGGSNLVPTGGSASIAGGGPSITISYAAQNRPPVANDDPYTINEDTPLAANVLSNDYDPDGDALRVYLSSSNSNVKGVLDLKQPDGSLE